MQRGAEQEGGRVRAVQQVGPGGVAGGPGRSAGTRGLLRRHIPPTRRGGPGLMSTQRGAEKKTGGPAGSAGNTNLLLKAWRHRESSPWICTGSGPLRVGDRRSPGAARPCRQTGATGTRAGRGCPERPPQFWLRPRWLREWPSPSPGRHKPPARFRRLEAPQREEAFLSEPAQLLPVHRSEGVELDPALFGKHQALAAAVLGIVHPGDQPGRLGPIHQLHH
jgi:hypothetical protein